MSFILSQNPVTSEREIDRLLPAIKLSASTVTFNYFPFDLRIKLIKCTLKFFLAMF